MRGTRWIMGGVLGPSSLFLVSKLPEGVLWGPIEVPDVSPGLLLVLGSCAGSLVFGGAVSLAGIIAATPLHYWNLFEVWSKFRLGRIPPEQYYEYGAVLDYQRLYGAMPLETRPVTQAEYVRRVVRMRMKAQQSPKGSPSRSSAPR